MNFSEYLNENDINADEIVQNHFKDIPTIDAFLEGKLDIIDYMLKNIDPSLYPYLYILTFSNMQEKVGMVRDLLKKHLEKSDYNEILDISGDKGYTEIIKNLLPTMSQIQVDRIFHDAVTNNYIDIVELLLDKASETTISSLLSNKHAIDYPEIFELLLTRADPESIERLLSMFERNKSLRNQKALDLIRKHIESN